MSPRVDVIVVGSGPGGVQAAQTLVEVGCTVTMLDAGVMAADDAAVVPDRSFEQLRRDDPGQHRYFLGDDFSGVPLARLGAAPQVTPPRRHVLRILEGHRAILADQFAAFESHALGGLGGAWGAVSFPYLDIELERSGLPPVAMRAHYERIARRIGISGAHDDLDVVRGPLEAMQPTLPADHNAAGLLACHERKRTAFHRRRLYLGRPLLAALSQDLDGRRAHGLHDTDFWGNTDGSVYRPDWTITRLAASTRFQHERGWRVESFAAPADVDGVTVSARQGGDGEMRTFTGRRLVLAAGALGTARIVLNSFRHMTRAVPLVCNAHLYVPCLHLRKLGRLHAERCHSLAQLTMIHDPTGDAAHLVQAQMYSYRSLLLFRLIKECPLPAREALWIMQALAPSFAIWAIEEEDEPAPQRFCRLIPCRDGSTTLEVVSPVSADVEDRRRRDEAALMRGMRMLGCWPIRRVHSGPGSSLHYGGQFPYSPCEEPFTTDEDGRLRGTRAVFVVDGSALRYLPAKGLTFTLMANADRVATEIARNLSSLG